MVRATLLRNGLRFQLLILTVVASATPIRMVNFHAPFQSLLPSVDLARALIPYAPNRGRHCVGFKGEIRAMVGSKSFGHDRLLNRYFLGLEALGVSDGEDSSIANSGR